MGESREHLHPAQDRTADQHDVVPARTKPPAANEAIHLDGTRTLDLLFRKAINKAETALADTSDQRVVSLALAASEVANAAREATELAGHGTVRWDQLSERLSVLLQLASEVRRAMDISGVESVIRDLDGAIAEFQANVPVEVVPSATKSSGTAALSTVESAQLARLSIAAAAERVAAFKTEKGSEATFRDQSIALCSSVPIHLITAREAAMAIADRRKRFTISDDVRRLSGELDFVHGVLAETPRQPWHRSFAQLFDEENRLRAAVGLAAVSRTYTGTIDPEDAKRAAMTGGNGLRKAGVVFSDPQSAVQGIGSSIGGIYERRIDAVRDVAQNLTDPAVPQDRSWFDTLVRFGAKLAITVATDGLADIVTEKIGRMLDGRDLAKLGSAIDHLNQDEKEIVEDQLKKLSESGRKLAMKTARQGLLQLVKDPTIKALDHSSAPQTLSLNPAHAFEQHQRDVFRTAQQDAGQGMAAVATALAQLDVETLNEMARVLNDQVRVDAHQQQYAASLAAWENLKAQAAAGVSGKAESPSGHGASVTRPNVDGVLDVFVDVDSDPRAGRIHLASLVLNGAEPSTLHYYRDLAPVTISSARLNRLFVVRMSDLGDPMALSVCMGPDGRLHSESISRRDLRILKVYASGDRVRGGNAFAAFDGEYDHVPDSAAIHVAHMIINGVMRHSTAELEDTK